MLSGSRKAITCPIGVSAIGEYSIRKTPDAYLGLARVCGLKNDPKEALQLLIAAQRAPDDVATSIGLASAPLKSYLAPGWPVIATEADLNALKGRRVWIVTAFDDHVLAGQEATMARIAREYNLAASFDGTLGGGTVKVYRKTAEAELKETSR